MAAPLPFAESEIRLLTALLRARVRFMVVGLAAATLQGAPVVTQDVGLWFEKLGDLKIARALQSVGAAYVPPSHLNPPMLAGPGAELFDIVVRMDGLDTFARELKHCVDVPLGRHKLKVLSLPRILHVVSKLAVVYHELGAAFQAGRVFRPTTQHAPYSFGACSRGGGVTTTSQSGDSGGT